MDPSGPLETGGRPELAHPLRIAMAVDAIRTMNVIFMDNPFIRQVSKRQCKCYNQVTKRSQYGDICVVGMDVCLVDEGKSPRAKLIPRGFFSGRRWADMAIKAS